MSTERDTPMLYDTAGGTQAVKAQTQTHKYKCAMIEEQTLMDTCMQHCTHSDNKKSLKIISCADMRVSLFVRYRMNNFFLLMLSNFNTHTILAK